MLSFFLVTRLLSRSMIIPLKVFETFIINCPLLCLIFTDIIRLFSMAFSASMALSSKFPKQKLCHLNIAAVPHGNGFWRETVMPAIGFSYHA